MRTLEQILANLNEEQKQLLADTINYGAWGSCDFDSECEVYAYGYITNDAYMGNHFNRRSLSTRFQSLFKALGLQGNKYCKDSEEIRWIYDWWGDGSGSILLIREELVDEIEKWARENK